MLENAGMINVNDKCEVCKNKSGAGWGVEVGGWGWVGEGEGEETALASV